MASCDDAAGVMQPCVRAFRGLGFGAGAHVHGFLFSTSNREAEIWTAGGLRAAVWTLQHKPWAGLAGCLLTSALSDILFSGDLMMKWLNSSIRSTIPYRLPSGSLQANKCVHVQALSLLLLLPTDLFQTQRQVAINYSGVWTVSYSTNLDDLYITTHKTYTTYTRNCIRIQRPRLTSTSTSTTITTITTSI